MAYWLDKWMFNDSIEFEYKYAGKYGAKGEQRQKRKKATPEQIRKQNQKNKEKKMRRIIKANFSNRDLWVTLKYPAGTRLDIETVKSDIRKFNQKMRRAYKKCNEEYKFINRIEIGKQGGIHIHAIINRPESMHDIDLLIREKWKYPINYQTLYNTGGYEQLASYIVKQEQSEQIEMFEDKEKLSRYSTSRNLVRPQPERKVYSHWTIRRMIENGPTPTKGYYIDKNSIHIGINPYTGMSNCQYTEYRLSGRGQPLKEGDHYETS